MKLLAEIIIPKANLGKPTHFLKFGLRKGQALALVNAAASFWVDWDKQTFVAPRIALGAVAPKVIRAPQAEAFLEGRKITPEVMAEAGRVAVNDAKPISDFRASAGYRKNLVAVLTKRALEGAYALAQDQAIGRYAMVTVTINVNGENRTASVPPETTLLRLLRDNFDLTGSKLGLRRRRLRRLHGDCGRPARQLLPDACRPSGWPRSADDRRARHDGPCASDPEGVRGLRFAAVRILRARRDHVGQSAAGSRFPIRRSRRFATRWAGICAGARVTSR